MIMKKIIIALSIFVLSTTAFAQSDYTPYDYSIKQDPFIAQLNNVILNDNFKRIGVPSSKELKRINKEIEKRNKEIYKREKKAIKRWEKENKKVRKEREKRIKKIEKREKGKETVGEG